MKPDDLAALPDGMNAEEVEPYFRELLQLARSPDSTDSLAIARAFWQLADRQWHAYEPLARELQEQVDDWVVRNWDSSSREFVETIVGVIARLALPRAWDTLKASVQTDLSDDVRAEIEAAIAELERGDPGDPWSGMRMKD